MDEIWKESRLPPNMPIRLHHLKYAGVDVSAKLSSLRSELANAGCTAIVISMLDEIAWVLNLVILLIDFAVLLNKLDLCLLYESSSPPKKKKDLL